jgi:hypothetical protein
MSSFERKPLVRSRNRHGTSPVTLEKTAKSWGREKQAATARAASDVSDSEVSGILSFSWSCPVLSAGPCTNTPYGDHQQHMDRTFDYSLARPRKIDSVVSIGHRHAELQS